MYIVISSNEDQISDTRMQSRNSTTEPQVHIAHNRCQNNLLT